MFLHAPKFLWNRRIAYAFPPKANPSRLTPVWAFHPSKMVTVRLSSLSLSVVEGSVSRTIHPLTVLSPSLFYVENPVLRFIQDGEQQRTTNGGREGETGGEVKLQIRYHFGGENDTLPISGGTNVFACTQILMKPRNCFSAKG